MRELLRQIQRVEQLSPAIHWHGNLSDSDMGRDLLVKNNNSITKNSFSMRKSMLGVNQRAVHRGQESAGDAWSARQAVGHHASELCVIPGGTWRGLSSPWKHSDRLSTRFFQVLSVMVPLADGESEEEELLPSRRASLRSLYLLMLHYWWLSFELVAFFWQIMEKNILKKITPYFDSIYFDRLTPWSEVCTSCPEFRVTCNSRLKSWRPSSTIRVKERHQTWSSNNESLQKEASHVPRLTCWMFEEQVGWGTWVKESHSSEYWMHLGR